MMVKLLAGALIASAAIGASPALAVDAYSVFNGTNGAGGFYYGSANGTALTDFNATGTGSSCFLSSGSGTCLYSTTFGAIPGVQKGGSFSTVNYSGTTLALHPLADGNSTAGVFAAFEPTKFGRYNYSIKLQSIGTDTTNGVGYRLFIGDSNFGSRSVLRRYLKERTLTGRVTLSAGERFGTLIDANGSYFGDTTGLSFTIAAVPEPTQWALMIGGFGMVGFSARRRRTFATA